MNRPTCKTCVYWKDLEIELEGQTQEGMCQRYAPAPVPHDHDDECCPFVDWPVTLSTEGCGEHQAFPGYIAWVLANPGKRIEFACD